jgi:hypothetical protein
MSNYKPALLVLAGIVLGLAIAWSPKLVPDANAANGDHCWLEVKSNGQQFEDAINKKAGEGYKNVVGYEHAVYNNGAWVSTYSALLCKQ